MVSHRRHGHARCVAPRPAFESSGGTSVDILKSGGYKLSALEIEEVLREHPAVAEVAVVGLPDAAWGDRVVACVVRRGGVTCDAADLRAFVRERLAPYKVPKDVLFLAELPEERPRQGGKARSRSPDRETSLTPNARSPHPFPRSEVVAVEVGGRTSWDDEVARLEFRLLRRIERRRRVPIEALPHDVVPIARGTVGFATRWVR